MRLKKVFVVYLHIICCHTIHYQTRFEGVDSRLELFIPTKIIG